MILDKETESFQCVSCGEHGFIDDYDLVKEALMQHIFMNSNIFVGSMKEELMRRCADHYPIQIVLNNGIIIECLTDEVLFYDDHFQLSQKVGQNSAKIIFPNNVKSDFHPRQTWVPYISISFITDAAS